MTDRPNDIPDDVWNTAPLLWGHEARIGIARSIMAERLRCLSIANGWLIAFAERGEALRYTTPQEWANGAVSDIADAIQSGLTP